MQKYSRNDKNEVKRLVMMSKRCQDVNKMRHVVKTFLVSKLQHTS